MISHGSGTLLSAVTTWAMAALEVAGLIAILAGVAVTTIGYLRDMAAGRGEAGYERYRRRLGRAILIGLELLVAADIVGTVAAPLDLRGVLALGLVVVIRTLLSLSIEVELSGRWPWQRARAEEAARRQPGG
jgi:uncharacterized membrane protein